MESLTFKGDGGDYFAILLVNNLLTILTLGLFHPWAKVRKLRYLHANTELAGSILNIMQPASSCL